MVSLCYTIYLCVFLCNSLLDFFSGREQLINTVYYFATLRLFFVILYYCFTLCPCSYFILIVLWCFPLSSFLNKVLQPSLSSLLCLLSLESKRAYCYQGKTKVHWQVIWKILDLSKTLKSHCLSRLDGKSILICTWILIVFLWYSTPMFPVEAHLVYWNSDMQVAAFLVMYLQVFTGSVYIGWSSDSPGQEKL